MCIRDRNVIDEILKIAHSYTGNDLGGDNYQISQHCDVKSVFTASETYKQILLQECTAEDTIDETEESPENVITSTMTIGGGNYRRGISGYIYEKLELTDRKSLQAIFWERTCDLLDSIHTFTIGFNNDFWHEPPNYDEDNDDMDEELPWDEYYKQANSDMVSLEDDIVDLARKVSKAQKESEQVSYDRIIDFINSKDDYLNIEWADIESWKEAKKCLLSQMEKYFVKNLIKFDVVYSQLPGQIDENYL